MTTNAIDIDKIGLVVGVTFCKIYVTADVLVPVVNAERYL